MNITRILIILSLFLYSCKNEQSNSSKIVHNKNKISKINQNTSEFFFDNFIGRYEFDISENEGILYGNFYSPSTDSLLIFNFIPKNKLSRKICNEIAKKAGDEYVIKQKLLIQNINHFNVIGYKIDYSYVLEQKDAGGSPVFNVKKPFKAQSFEYKDGKIIMGEIKTYQKFSEIY